MLFKKSRINCCDNTIRELLFCLRLCVRVRACVRACARARAIYYATVRVNRLSVVNAQSAFNFFPTSNVL